MSRVLPLGRVPRAALVLCSGALAAAVLAVIVHIGTLRLPPDSHADSLGGGDSSRNVENPSGPGGADRRYLPPSTSQSTLPSAVPPEMKDTDGQRTLADDSDFMSIARRLLEKYDPDRLIPTSDPEASALVRMAWTSTASYEGLLDFMKSLPNSSWQRKLWVLVTSGASADVMAPEFFRPDFLGRLAKVAASDAPLYVRLSASQVLAANVVRETGLGKTPLEPSDLSTLAHAFRRFEPSPEVVHERGLARDLSFALGAAGGNSPEARRVLMEVAADLQRSSDMRCIAWQGLWLSSRTDEEILKQAAWTLSQEKERSPREAALEGGIVAGSHPDGGAPEFDTAAKLSYLREIERIAASDPDEGLRWKAIRRLAVFGRRENSTLIREALRTLPVTSGEASNTRLFVWATLANPLRLAEQPEFLDDAIWEVRHAESAGIRSQVVEVVGTALRAEGFRAGWKDVEVRIGEDRYRRAMEALEYASESDSDPSVRKAAKEQMDRAIEAADVRASSEHPDDGPAVDFLGERDSD